MSINIKGKNYVMVNERIKEFRENFKGWAITTELVAYDAESCIFKALAIDENGVIKATGYAQEDRTSSMINKTSYIENCETSAVGRCLGILGIGIDESVASAEEVDMAIRKQELNKPISVPKQNGVCESCGAVVESVVASYSKKYFGKCLCRECQKLVKPKEVEI